MNVYLNKIFILKKIDYLKRKKIIKDGRRKIGERKTEIRER